MLGQHHSEETKKLLSERHKGKHHSEETRKLLCGRIPWNKGLKGAQQAWNKGLKGKSCSEETKRLIRNRLKGRIISEKTRKLISARNKGKKRSEEIRRLMSEHTKGRHPSEATRKLLGKHRIGKHHSEKTKKLISENSKGKNKGILRSEVYKKLMSERTKGKKLSEKTKKLISEHHKGIHLSEESKQKLRLWFSTLTEDEKRKHLVKCMPHRVSRPQKELFEFLRTVFADATLEYQIKTEKTWRFADIGVPSLKIDFEYDGYFNYNRHNPEKDKIRDQELANVSWKTIRVNKNNLKEIMNQKDLDCLKHQRCTEINNPIA